jgi:hypothetical protein
MNRQFRFALVALLTLVIALSAAGAWAAPRFQGTVPPPPQTGTSGPGTTPQAIDMGTAIFVPECTDCTVLVEAVAQPAALAAAPAGKAFLGDAFKVSITGPAGGTVKISFALPPELAGKDAKIYKLNTDANPPFWTEVPGGVIVDGVISVSGGPGVYALIGNP